MGAALVLETAAAMPERRKFSLNPSFALVLLVFAMVLVGNVEMVLECSCCYYCLIPAWIPVKCNQMMEPGYQCSCKMRQLGLELSWRWSVPCWSLQWTLTTAETWSVPSLLILGWGFVLGRAVSQWCHDLSSPKWIDIYPLLDFVRLLL